MAKKNYHIRSNKKSSKQLLEVLPKPCLYRGTDYGLPSTLQGGGTRICIIDTGTPEHKDIPNIGLSVNMSDSRDNKDHHGHATMVSGIVGGVNDSGIQGIAPEAEFLFSKVVNNSGECSFNNILASVLWAVVKKVDVILISLGSRDHYGLLHDAIKKAYSQDICILAASGPKGEESYPATYEEVLSVSQSPLSKKENNNAVRLKFPRKGLHTTYLNNQYTRASGSSLTCAAAAGLAALLIEKNRCLNADVSPEAIYKELSSLDRISK